MKLRYVLCRIGEDPGRTEVDEAVELVKLFNEERGQWFCPLMGIT
jgi:hypothetical protein